MAAAKAKAYPDPPDVNKLTNPLTQILMLTAIVVGVATLGVGLALAQKVYQQHNSFDEDEILETKPSDRAPAHFDCVGTLARGGLRCVDELVLAKGLFSR